MVVIVAVAAQAVKTSLMRRAVKLVLVLAPIVAVCWVVGAMVLTMLFMGGQVPPGLGASGSTDCTVAVQAFATKSSLDDRQLRNAATVVAVGRQMRVPAYGWVVAIATAMQESHLTNLPGGDGSSVGMFQQVASWGTVAQRMDVAWSSRKFFASLVQVPGWTGMSVTVAAQAVQRSAFPNAYQQWAALAASVVGDPAVAQATCAVGDEFPQVAGPQGSPAAHAELIAFGRRLQALGFTVGEHPAFGGVTLGVHADHSWHYRAGAIDVNHDGAGQSDETAAINTIVPLARQYGLRTIWQYPGHFDHAHFDIGAGPDLGNFK